MTLEDQYVLAVVERHRALEDDPEPERVRRGVEQMLRGWALGAWVESVTIAGSLAKGTALRDGDVDLLVSLAHETPGTLAEMHASLAWHFRDHVPRPRNVSLRICWEGSRVDVVPARRRAGSPEHTLWRLRDSTWLQTDVARQVRVVRASGRAAVIRALKIWRRRNALRMPSFLAELAAMRGTEAGRGMAESFTRVLEFLAGDFRGARLVDPGNSNNVVSDVLTEEEKVRVASAAEISLRHLGWEALLG